MTENFIKLNNLSKYLQLALFVLLILMMTILNVSSSEEKHDVNKIRIKDSHGKWAFDQPPQRIAVINWTLAEQLFELGITPVAIADITGFKQTTPQTKLPENHESIIDVGSRFSPKLELLKQSNPELIIIGYSQRDLMRPLSNIAPVMYFNNFSRRGDNLERIDKHFMSLATLFNKSTFAKQLLASRDSTIEELKQKIAAKFQEANTPLPAVTAVSQKDEDIWAFLNGSVPYGILIKLGLAQELTEKPSKLGTHKLNEKQLNELKGCLIFINNSTATKSSVNTANSGTNNTLMTSEKCQLMANAANTFGGSMSQLYLAESFSTALLNSLK